MHEFELLTNRYKNTTKKEKTLPAGEGVKKGAESVTKDDKDEKKENILIFPNGEVDDRLAKCKAAIRDVLKAEKKNRAPAPLATEASNQNDIMEPSSVDLSPVEETPLPGFEVSVLTSQELVSLPEKIERLVALVQRALSSEGEPVAADLFRLLTEAKSWNVTTELLIDIPTAVKSLRTLGKRISSETGEDLAGAAREVVAAWKRTVTGLEQKIGTSVEISGST